MKGIVVAILALLLFGQSVLGADWAFYGSQRIGTWYNDRDYGDATVNGKSDDRATQWYFQGNSRLGAKVTADKVKGQIEISLSASDGGTGGDGDVGTRRAYGTWRFSDNASLKVGKDYSPVTDFLSNQWYNSDNDLLGEGNFYGRRPAGLTLILGNFEIAALTPSYGADVGTTDTGINGTTGGDPDSYIPRFEASYQLGFGPGYIRPFGGFQWYKVEGTGNGNVTGDLDVWSYVAGLSTNWDIGRFTLGGQLSYGVNEGAVTGWATGSNARASSLPYLKNGDDIADVYTLQALFVAALRATDTLRFETGIGYRLDNPDGASGPGNGEPDGVWSAYLQALITLAPGVYLGPEVGYYDYMDAPDGTNQGHLWYVGAKWQIDF